MDQPEAKPKSEAVIAAKDTSLPQVESPSICPVENTAVEAEPAAPAASATPPLAGEPPAYFEINLPTIRLPKLSLPKVTLPKIELPKFTMPALTIPQISVPRIRPRHKYRAALVACAVVAMIVGAATGGLAVSSLQPDRIAAERATAEKAAAERASIAQAAVTKLNKEIGSLKAAADSAEKSSRATIAKLNERIEKLDRPAASDVTGSLPSTQAAAVPLPRPAPAETRAARAVVPGWHVVDVRRGQVLVEGQYGVYEVVPGAPLPGLGRVDTITRENGRWVVVTPKGIIVSMRDRPHFQQF